MKHNTLSLLGCLLTAACLSCTTQAKADPVTVTVDTVPAGQAIVVDGTNYVAPADFSWDPDSPHTLVAPSPQTNADGHSQRVFSAWSDGGAQTNQILTPDTDTNYTASFSTQYLLDVTITPTGAGTVSNYPAGPWYSAGQVVSLTAKTNIGYRFSVWQGTDSQVTNTAQVTMDGYHLVQGVFVPSDYPYIVVANNGGAAPGSLIGNIDGRSADGTKLYYVVLDNTGTNIVFANKTNTLYRFVTPQGFDAVSGSGNFVLKDETITPVDAFTTVGFTVDNHDMKLLPNGHALVFGSEVRTVDMSKLYPGGNAAASVTGDILQEIDANKHVVFEWHTFDYIAITNTFADMTQASFDYAHLNAMSIDPTDNNLLVSLRTTSEIVKINRQTGQVMWRLGGKMNQFTFIGEHAENAPYYTVGQHDIHRLPNGNLLYFDNGNIQGGGTTPSDRTYSRGVEYQIDELNKTATLVWEFRHTPDISAGCTGQIRRYPNGNTAIGWGCAIASSGTIMTEVDATNKVVFEVKHRNAPGSSSLLLGNGLIKQAWNTPDLIRSDSYQGIVAGQTYSSSLAGVSVTFNNLTGATNNQLVIQRHMDAVRFPQFSARAPQVLMQQVVFSGSNITAFAADLSLQLPDTSSDFDTPVIKDPTKVVVYQRPTPGQGQFSALATTYDAGTQTLSVTNIQLGEFIFGYPDVTQTASIATLRSPADQSQVSQSQPVTLVWTPQGLVNSCQVQVATDAGFGNLVVDTNGLAGNSYVLSNLVASTYYWRVRAVADSGPGDWSTASFTAVAPFIQVTYPAGGEVWQRYSNYVIRWSDNLSGNVGIDLYVNGVSNRTPIASTADTGSYAWNNLGQFAALLQNSNCTIKVRSVSTPAIYAFSQPFSIITNLTRVTFVTAPPGLRVTVDGTNCITPTNFNWLPFTSHTLDTTDPQVAGDGHSRSVFAAWTDGGARSHSYSAPFWAATNTASFTTNYLLDMASTPPAAGSIAANPVGPWYNLGQLVSLTASANDGYLFYDWNSVDSKTQNTAQVTMNGYKSVQAKFISISGIPLIDGSSLVHLGGGGMQFSFTAGAGAASQATVWATPTLSPPDWQTVGIVTLSGSNGVFTESAPFTNSTRFFRITLP